MTDFGKNEQGGQIYFLNLISKQTKHMRVWWKTNLKNLSEHARLLGTSDYSFCGYCGHENEKKNLYFAFKGVLTNSVKKTL